MYSYRLNNIKSFKDSGDVEIKPLTIFVGKNSCGKSSLIRFPVVLAQTFQSESENPLKFYGKLIDYGNYEDVVHGLKKGDISFGISYPLAQLVNNDRIRQKTRKTVFADYDILSVKSTIRKQSGSLEVKDFALYCDNTLMLEVKKNRGRRYTLLLYVRYGKNGFENDELIEIDDMPIIFSQYYPRIITSPQRIGQSIYGNDFKMTELPISSPEKRMESYYMSTMEYVYETENMQLSSEERRVVEIAYTLSILNSFIAQAKRCTMEEATVLSYIGPFRSTPERIYRDQEIKSSFVGTSGENISTLLINDYHKNNVLINKVSDWLKANIGYSINVVEVGSGLYKLVLMDKNGVSSNIIDVGYGIAQVLPIVVELIRDQANIGMGRTSSYDKLIIVEQPELHLHPAAQSELADLFVNSIRSKRKILIETHSEHLIRKIQVLVANKTISKDDIKIYYVDKDEKGEAFIEEMKLLPNGKFENKWPEGFFDKAYQLSLELVKANKLE